MKKKVLIGIIVVILMIGLFLLANYLIHKNDCCSACDETTLVCPSVCAPCKGAIFK